MQDWTGYLFAGFAPLWIANFYVGLFGPLRQDIKKEKTEITEIEKNISSKENLPDEIQIHIDFLNVQYLDNVSGRFYELYSKTISGKFCFVNRHHKNYRFLSPTLNLVPIRPR